MNKFMICLLFVFLIVGCSENKTIKYDQLENNMKTVVDKFYQEQMKSNLEETVDILKVTINTLKKGNYEVKNLKNPKTGTACSDDSYANIIFKSKKTNGEREYTIENHLSCGDYQSPES